MKPDIVQGVLLYIIGNRCECWHPTECFSLLSIRVYNHG